MYILNDELLEMAQDEYARQYQLWLASKPHKESIVDNYEKLQKILKKYLDSKKTDKENGSGDES